MREIDLATWTRRHHFETFRSWHDPTFSIDAEVDVTAFRAAVRESPIRMTAAITYLVARTANELPEFRWRIRGDTVVEHAVVHPSSTVLVDDDLFGFCDFEYRGKLSEFAAGYAASVERATQSATLEDPDGRDDLLFMTAIPWVSFTSFTHPVPTMPVDSVPRMAWGKIVERNGTAALPLSVQGHHALMDGVHIARYFERFQALASEPDSLFG